jgi:hypothetical protein
MKNVHLVISIVVILALVCSPALAISKADLIASYGQSAPTVTPPSSLPVLNVTPDDRSQWWRPTKPMPTQTPTQTPTPITTSDALPLWVSSTPSRALVFIDGFSKGLTPITIDDISIGTHQLRLSRAGYEDYSTEILIPERSPPRCDGLYCWGQNYIAIDVTLKKVESTLKPTIPTIIPSPTPTPTIIPTTVPTPAPSNWPYPIVPDSSIKTKRSYLDSLSELFL